MKSVEATGHELTSLTWVALDPGKTGHSRNKYEILMLDQLKSADLEPDWVTSHPVNDLQPRYIYAFSNSSGVVEDQNLIQQALKIEGVDHESDLLLNATTRSAELAENLRFVKFPSEIEEFSIHSAEELIRRTAIEEIIAIGGSGEEEMIVETFNHLRPVIYNGALTLFVEKSWDGNFTPIERPTPHECCGGEEH